MSLPHRFPFRLVDRRGDVARFALSAGAFWHRARSGVGLPLLAEAAAQAAAELLAPEGASDEQLVLAALSDCHLTRIPGAGEMLELEVAIEARLGPTVRLSAKVRAGDEIARMTLTLARPAGGSGGR